MPGIGPWTVDYVAMRALGDPDAFPGTDLILKRKLAGLNPKLWSPWRSYAAMHLWLDHLTTTGAL
jgi:AraC family transcriptional regulator of adaptative response / DNA-3-methyladenine glycosylase II